MVEWLRTKIDSFKQILWLKTEEETSRYEFVMKDEEYYTSKYLGMKIKITSANIVDEIKNIKILVDKINDNAYIMSLADVPKDKDLPQWLSSGEMCISGITELVRELYVNIRILEVETDKLDIYKPKVRRTKVMLLNYIVRVNNVLSLVRKIPK